MKISPELLADLGNCLESIDCDTNPVVIAAHAPWLRQIADEVEKQVNAPRIEEDKCQP